MSDKLPRAKRLTMINKRLANIRRGAGDFPEKQRREEIRRLKDLYAAVWAEK